MSVFVRQRMVWLLVVWTVGGLVCSPEALAKPDALRKKFEEGQIELQQLKKEIQDIKKKTNQIEKEQDSALKTIETLDRRSVEKRKESEAINRQLKDTDRQLEDIGKRLADSRSRLKDGRQAVRTRLRVLYMEGRVGHLQTLLTSQSYDEFQRRYDYLSAIAKRGVGLLETYRVDLAEVEDLKDRQAAARVALLKHKQKTEKKWREIRQIKSKKRKLLASLNKKHETQDQALAAKKRMERQKESLLKELLQRSKLEEAKAKRPKGGRLKAGSLIWPTDGEVVSLFGRQRHPTFNTFVNKKGIEIRTTEGSSIRAVSSGTVVYADWLKGYGLVVILEHPNGFFSLYAHASKVLVEEGSRVRAGQLIGETGESGMTEESVLYFELRKGTEPVDPLRWLVKRP